MSEPTDKKPHAITSSADDDSLLRKIAHVSEAEPVATTITGPGGPLTPARSGSVPGELPGVGSLIDQRYRVESVLGEGGMGVVFAARNQRTGREVALKLMVQRERLSEAQHTARAERFFREARAAGRIRHPNVVDVYDVGGDSDAPYLVMERLRGRTLGALIAEGPLPERKAVELVLAAARGVAAAHEEGVVHRDLKPDNIFLADMPSGPAVPKVLDFGISRIITHRESLDSLTRSGTILGTPAYMAYEQLRGSNDIDARADVYALGVILYEALSARRPFEANSFHDLVLRMAHDEPTPLAKVQPLASRRVRDVVARCLERDPEQRYANAGELVNALERVLGAPDQHEQKPLPSRKSARKWPLIAAVVLFAVLAALWLVSRPVRGPRDALPPASTQAQPSTPPAKQPSAPALQKESPPPEDTADQNEAPSSSPAAATKPRPPPARRPKAMPPEPDKFERARELRQSDF